MPYDFSGIYRQSARVRQHELPSQLVSLLADPIAALPIPLERLKEHCAVDLDYHDEDDLITGYCKSAYKLVESHAEYVIFEQDFRLELKDLPVHSKDDIGGTTSTIRLEKTPISEVTLIQVRKEDKSLVTLDLNDCEIYLSADPPLVILDRDIVYAAEFVPQRRDSIQITFTAGTLVVEDGTVTGDLNDLAIQAILYLVGLQYQKREPVHAWNSQELKDMPLTYKSYIEAISWRGC